MIMEILKPDTDTIRACSLALRSFRTVAQSFLGRHISVHDLNRLKASVRFLNNSGFHHVRSLSLGITTKRTILEEYWNNYLEILGVFAQRRSLVRLWLYEVPFSFLQPRQKKRFRDIVVALSSSINDLGLYGCHFSCYEEMISFVRAFPHCDKLHIQDCVTGGRDSPKNPLAGLPQYRLSVVDLDITASSTHKLLIDHSGLVEDAELDVSSLCKLTCDLRSAAGIRRLILAASGSPVRELRFSSARSNGFQGTFTYILLPNASSYRNQSAHNVGATRAAPGITDRRTHVPQSGFNVLGGRTQGLPATPLLDQNPNHPSLPHVQSI